LLLRDAQYFGKIEVIKAPDAGLGEAGKLKPSIPFILTYAFVPLRACGCDAPVSSSVLWQSLRAGLPQYLQQRSPTIIVHYLQARLPAWLGGQWFMNGEDKLWRMEF